MWFIHNILIHRGILICDNLITDVIQDILHARIERISITHEEEVISKCIKDTKYRQLLNLSSEQERRCWFNNNNDSIWTKIDEKEWKKRAPFAIVLETDVLFDALQTTQYTRCNLNEGRRSVYGVSFARAVVRVRVPACVCCERLCAVCTGACCLVFMR